MRWKPYDLPESIKFNSSLKLTLLEHKPLLACFGFVTRQKYLVSRKNDLRKRLNLIDSGVKIAIDSVMVRKYI
jgi:hypothetical protein